MVTLRIVEAVAKTCLNLRLTVALLVVLTALSTALTFA